MFLSIILSVSCILFGQDGSIAYITGPSQAAYQLTVFRFDTGETTAPGRGDCDAYPQWSPDGRSIAYQTKQPEGTGIRIIRPEEPADQAVAHHFSWNYRPRWSPDSASLVYTSRDDTSPLSCITVYSFERGEETFWGGEQRGILSVAWLPGMELMKALDPESEDEHASIALLDLRKEAEAHGLLVSVGLIGTPPKMYTDLFITTPSLATPVLSFLEPDNQRHIEYNVNPDHDARQIAYESNDGGDRELFVLGRRGITNVSNHPAADWNPVWSPDDSWLAFESFRGGRQGIYRVLVSTGNVLPVHVGNAYNCWSPDWSPDGEWMVFVSDMSGTPQLFVIRPDGSDLRQLTFGPFPALSPTWQPVSKHRQE